MQTRKHLLLDSIHCRTRLALKSQYFLFKTYPLSYPWSSINLCTLMVFLMIQSHEFFHVFSFRSAISLPPPHASQFGHQKARRFVLSLFLHLRSAPLRSLSSIITRVCFPDTGITEVKPADIEGKARPVSKSPTPYTWACCFSYNLLWIWWIFSQTLKKVIAFDGNTCMKYIQDLILSVIPFRNRSGKQGREEVHEITSSFHHFFCTKFVI